MDGLVVQSDKFDVSVCDCDFVIWVRLILALFFVEVVVSENLFSDV